MRPLLARYPKEGADVEFRNFREMSIPNNQKVLFKKSPLDGAKYAYTPNLKGGAIQYTVDLRETECGCVAGAYAMAISGGCDPEAGHSAKPNCPTIDIMQANKYGFNVAANPCDGGACDPISKCQYKMKEEGAKRYGEYSYGPGGEMINTDEPFDVMTQFITESD